MSASKGLSALALAGARLSTLLLSTLLLSTLLLATGCIVEVDESQDDETVADVGLGFDSSDEDEGHEGAKPDAVQTGASTSNCQGAPDGLSALADPDPVSWHPPSGPGSKDDTETADHD